MESYTTIFLYTLIRVILGLLFFFQAFDKIYGIKLVNVYDEVLAGTRHKGIPDAFTKLSVYLNSYLELIAGFALIIGLFTLPALFLLGIHLVFVVMAFSYMRGIWDMQHVMSRLVLLGALLLLPQAWNSWSLDALFNLSY